jgi:hypothetical protein
MPEARWQVDSCPLVLAPTEVLITEMLPAITGENALPPYGHLFDDEAIATACSHIAPTSVPLGDSAGTRAREPGLTRGADRRARRGVPVVPRRLPGADRPEDRIALRDAMRAVGAAACALFGRFADPAVPISP